MASHFERITTESNEPFGLPTIRDTGITVSDVVRPIVSGEKSVSEVLDAHPALELEDVHQALAFAVRDIGFQLHQMDHDVTDSLTPIQTYSIGMNKPELRDHFLKKISLEEIHNRIFKHSKNARNLMLLTMMWAWHSYTNETWHEPVDNFTVLDMIAQIKKELHSEELREHTHLAFSTDGVPENLKISTPYSTIYATFDLCVCILRPSGIKKIASQLYADYDQSRQLITITINHTYEQNTIFSPLWNYKEYSFPEIAHIGKLLLQRNHIQVHTFVTDHTITFTFDLSIAENE